jgi:hypothetical protein
MKNYKTKSDEIYIKTKKEFLRFIVISKSDDPIINQQKPIAYFAESSTDTNYKINKGR